MSRVSCNSVATVRSRTLATLSMLSALNKPTAATNTAVATDFPIIFCLIVMRTRRADNISAVCNIRMYIELSAPQG
jgi:hypothetical protein